MSSVLPRLRSVFARPAAVKVKTTAGPADSAGRSANAVARTANVTARKAKVTARKAKAAEITAKRQERLDSLAQSLKRSHLDFWSRTRVPHNAVRRLASAGRISIIEDILEEQKQHISSPDDDRFANFLIGLYGMAGMFDHARKLFDEMPALNTAYTIKSLNCLIQACIKSKRFNEVEPLLQELLAKLSLKPDIVTYNTLISAYCHVGSIDQALSVIDELSEKGLEPDRITFAPLLKFFYRSGRFEEGDRIWDLMESKNVSPNATTFHIRLQALISHDKLGDAVQLFDDMEMIVQPDAICYNALIFIFCKKGDAEEVKRWYRRMLQSNCSPDFMTMSNVIPFFRKKGDLEMAYELCIELMNMPFRGSPPIVQSVVDALVQQSKLGLAQELIRLDSSALYDLKMPSGN